VLVSVILKFILNTLKRYLYSILQEKKVYLCPIDEAEKIQISSIYTEYKSIQKSDRKIEKLHT
jgi:hypothetical protein